MVKGTNASPESLDIPGAQSEQQPQGERGRGWRNRIIGLGEEDPTQLLANPFNFRLHNGPQRDALRGSLNTVGWSQAVVVNQRTGFVVDGHLRIEEALSRHEKTVPVLYVDLSPEEEAIVLATLDPIAAMADRDQERLNALLAEIHVDDEGLQALLDSLNKALPDEPKKSGGHEIQCPECGATFTLGG